MLKSLFRHSLAALCLFSLPAMVMADEDAAAQRLNTLLSNASTMTADFSQMTLNANGASMQETTGNLALKRPGMFRWHTDAPAEQELVSNGQTIWLYDPDLEQVTIQEMDQRLTHTPALLLSGDVSKLQENFTITWEDSGNVIDFTLTPKVSDTLFDSLRLSFRDGVINDMQMSDAVGQRTNILFQDVQLNQSMNEEQFTFDIPDGIDVISE
ncbi:outer membrane lipoprotein chaperone LolA [Halopseudomonas pelagia]|uniref:Outer-membrane lipoprotein carrier protein n=1 Tax=Halopseudomonas pelagia TaxID=553151 RepID=A0AA91U290_9GAMM|nr:outer membrane lipoprotein chaperone LolA [Halopseudomonas pelagia]PCC99428.1 outer membrane lipoprotein carrier protein LolA [Halopseudomonas pelagia]QFY57260.1 outer membrane lipoprotein chaperone LolA [Halopseudomonas pelagia]